MKKTHSFTLIELAVIVAILAILAAMLLPATAVVSEQAKLTGCLGNLKEIGKAVQTYAKNNNNHIEGLTGESGYKGSTGLPWSQNIYNILQDPKLFLCPADKTKNDRRGKPQPAKSSYGVVKISPAIWPEPLKSFTIDRLIDPAKFIHIMDAHNSWNNIGHASGAWQVTHGSRGGYLDRRRVSIYAPHENNTMSAAVHYDGSVHTYLYPEAAKNFPPQKKEQLFF
jgi:type II secretory pathway pseudopilin PulG